jgi:hypothetical protein
MGVGSNKRENTGWLQMAPWSWSPVGEVGSRALEDAGKETMSEASSIMLRRLHLSREQQGARGPGVC